MYPCMFCLISTYDCTHKKTPHALANLVYNEKCTIVKFPVRCRMVHTATTPQKTTNSIDSSVTGYMACVKNITAMTDATRALKISTRRASVASFLILSRNTFTLDPLSESVPSGKTPCKLVDIATNKIKTYTTKNVLITFCKRFIPS